MNKRSVNILFGVRIPSGILALFFALSSTLLPFCSPALAQQPGKIFRIGYLDGSTAAGSAVLVDAFRQELKKLGWTETEYRHRVQICRAKG